MNHTVVEFVLLGLTNSRHLEIILFLILVIAYFLILFGNVTVISITLVDHFLQTPMYFFLRNFMLLFFCLGTCTFFHVAAMSFDRYVAICRPLHYTTIMNNRFCFQLVLACWAVSFLLMSPPIIMIAQLPFCGPNVLNHFYCDTSQLLQLSCTDTWFIEGLLFILSIIIVPGTLTITVISYGCIIITILHMPSSSGRKKTFSTCSAHLVVVTVFYSTSIYRYNRTAQRGGQGSDKVLSFFFSVVTQMLNPYIYSLRNNQVKRALKESMSKAFSSSRRQP
uniref:G-protein coupled receptors family 1 profile domain-containing protein n=1 Tax=Anas platyrhynchos TaxID=8839 RepID=A0A8B9QPQ2_ANAPL